MKLRTRPFLLFSTAVAAVTFAASAHATDYTWGGGTGSWTDTNWGPGPVGGPTSNSDTATIGSGIVIVNVNDLGVGSLTMSGGTLQSGVSGQTNFNTPIQISGTGNVFNAPSGFNFALNGNLTGSGTASVAGQWAVGLGGDNSGFTGTWINGSLGSDNLTRFDTANSGSASASWVLNGGRMVNANNSSPTISLGSLSGTGGILSNNTSGQVTYSIGALNTDTTFSGQIVNEWGGGGTTAITKVGSGSLTLSGGLSYTGATVVNGGELKIQSGANYAGQTTSGYTLGNNSKLTFYSSNNLILDKAITGSGDLYIDGTGAGNQYENRVNIMSDGLKTFSGSVYVLANGKLAVWGGNGSGAIPNASVVDVAGLFTLYGTSETIGGLSGSGIVQGHNAVLTVANSANSTFSGTLRNNPNEGGALTVSKTGAGTLTLSGNNTYTGSTIVSGGTLELSGTNANGNLRVDGGALTRITGGTTTVASTGGDTYVTGGAAIEIDGGSLVINGGSSWFSVGDHPAIPDGDGTLTLTSGSFTNNNSWGIVVGEGNAGAGFVNINGGVFTANDTVNNSGLMLGNGTGASGTLNLNGGTLITDAIKGGPGSGTVNFNGGKLQATGDVFDIFQNNGSITTTIQSGGLKVGGTPNFAISEGMAGTGGLTKEDGNTVTLSGTNSYSGATIIKGGTLKINTSTSIGSSASITVGDTGSSGAALDATAAGFTVGSAQTLGGIGTIYATGQTVTASGTVSPGNSVGTLTIDGGTLVLDADTGFVFELGTSSDLISLVNSATLSLGSGTLGLADFLFSNSGGFGEGVYTLIGGASSFSGSLDSGDLTGVVLGYNSTLSMSGNNLVLTVIPEPRAALLGGLGLLALLRRRRR
jgi:autotransporter-associated beta strand protein